MTPEAVIHRYLQIVSSREPDINLLVALLSADADLLARWLVLLQEQTDFRMLTLRLAQLDSKEFNALAEAQAWAELPVTATARLSISQWQNVLRSAFLAQVLAEHLHESSSDAQSEVEDLRNIRLRALLAVSGVQLAHDPRLLQINEFRSINPALLEDAAEELRIFAVVDALEVGRESELAEQLLAIPVAHFEALLERAEQLADQLIDEIGLDTGGDVDWAHRIWLRQQLHSAAGALARCENWQDLADVHKRVCRPLFDQPPLIMHQSESDGPLYLLGSDQFAINRANVTSAIAAASRNGATHQIADGADLAVVDRQLLRVLGAEEALAVPINGLEVALVLLVSSEDQTDAGVLAQLYGEELANCVARITQGAQAAETGESKIDMVEAFRAGEYRRLREIVHEANNPLSIVHNYLHILELRLQHEAEAVEQLSLISSELRRAGEIFSRAREVPNISETAPVDNGQISELNITHWLTQVAELHSGYAQQVNVQIDTELPEREVSAPTQLEKLAQIVGNLVKNAIEACSGGDLVALGARSGVFRDGRMGVEVFVRDSGPGLPDEVLANLAEAKATQKGGDHQGIGLQVAFKLAAELDGAIDVRSEPGQGAVFTLFLPTKITVSGV